MGPKLRPVFRKTLLKKHIIEYYSQRDLIKYQFQSHHFTDKGKKREREKRKEKAH